MPYIQNLLSTHLIMKGGFLELAPGEYKLVTEQDLLADSVAYALKSNQAKTIEDPSKADPAPPALPPIISTLTEMAPSLSAEELQAFLAAKKTPAAEAPEVTPEPVLETVTETSADAAAPTKGRPKKAA